VIILISTGTIFIKLELDRRVTVHRYLNARNLIAWQLIFLAIKFERELSCRAVKCSQDNTFSDSSEKSWSKLQILFSLKTLKVTYEGWADK